MFRASPEPEPPVIRVRTRPPAPSKPTQTIASASPKPSASTLPKGLRPLTKEELEKQRLSVVNERICEVSRAVIAELGIPGALEHLEEALEARHLTAPKVDKPKLPKRRRWSIYPLEELGAAINAQAKAEGISANDLMCRILAEHLAPRSG